MYIGTVTVFTVPLIKSFSVNYRPTAQAELWQSWSRFYISPSLFHMFAVTRHFVADEKGKESEYFGKFVIGRNSTVVSNIIHCKFETHVHDICKVYI